MNFILFIIIIILIIPSTISTKFNDFSIILNNNYSCQVPLIKGPKKQYPDLWTLLSDQRPIYYCNNNQFKFYHYKGCWRLQKQNQDEQEDEEIACLKCWAITPLNFKTSCPKLITNNNIQIIPYEKPNVNEIRTFHLTDESRILKSLTSFYTKIAVDEDSNDIIYFGTSSQNFAWKYKQTWYFSAHWKNVGGAEHARTQCNIDVKTGRPSEDNCLRLNDDLNGWSKVKLSFKFDGNMRNAQDSLIIGRNRERMVMKHEFTLSNGLKIPMVGIGTGMLEPIEIPLEQAKEIGYGLIDTAAIYENEQEIGHTFIDSIKKPFIQTKVWPTELGYRRTINSLMISREKLNMPILDVALLHWPKCYSEWNVDWMDCSNADLDESGMLWLESWRALERLYAEGFILAIGVSNFDVDLLNVALEQTNAIDPMIVQNYLSLDHLDRQVVELCAKKNILYQAYAFFRQGFRNDKELLLIQQAMKLTNWNETKNQRKFLFQILLKNNIGFLVRSNKKEHLQENFINSEQSMTVTLGLFELFNDDDDILNNDEL